MLPYALDKTPWILLRQMPGRQTHAAAGIESQCRLAGCAPGVDGVGESLAIDVSNRFVEMRLCMACDQLAQLIMHADLIAGYWA